jgi:hypothetical protein
MIPALKVPKYRQQRYNSNDGELEEIRVEIVDG